MSITFQRIYPADYDQKDTATITKLADTINPFAESVIALVTNNLTISDNMNLSFKTFNVTVSSDGTQSVPPIATGLGRLCNGISVIKVINRTNGSVYPTGTPFLSFTESSSNILSIQNITNLPPSNQYSITALLF